MASQAVRSSLGQWAVLFAPMDCGGVGNRPPSAKTGAAATQSSSFLRPDAMAALWWPLWSHAEKFTVVPSVMLAASGACKCVLRTAKFGLDALP